MTLADSIEDFEPDFPPDQYSGEELNSLLREAGISYQYSVRTYIPTRVGNTTVHRRRK